MGAQMDRMMALTKYQVDRLKDLSEKFYLINDEPECVNVCFWYVPKRLRGQPHTKEKEIELGKVSRGPVSGQPIPRASCEIIFCSYDGFKSHQLQYKIKAANTSNPS